MKIAIVTGASSGMGREMTRLLTKRIGCLDELWLCARRQDRLSALSEELSGVRRAGRRPLRLRLFTGDLCKETVCSEIGAALALEQPEILFLVNAAGFGKIGRVSELSSEVQEEMLRLNCGATLRICRLCLPYMKRRLGRIINFASAAAFLPQPQFAVYAASKAFVLSFSEALREELRGTQVAVTAVCPGPVKTEFFGIAEELHAVALYKKLFMADAARVCEAALQDSLRRKAVSVYGFSMKAFQLLTHILPYSLLLSCMRVINRDSRQQTEKGEENRCRSL